MTKMLRLLAAALWLLAPFQVAHAQTLTGVGTSLPNPPTAINFKASNTGRLAKCQSQVRNKLGSCSIGFMKDSKGAGYTGSAVSNSFKVSVVAQLGAQFKAYGIDTMVQSRFATGGASETPGASDSRVSVTSGCALGSGQTLGGVLIQCTASGGTTTYTWDEPVDRITLYYAKVSAASFTYSLDGGAATTVNVAADTAAVGQINLTPAVSTHSLVVTWVSGTVFLSGNSATDTTRSALNLLNYGNRGTTAALQADTSQIYRALPMIPVSGPGGTLPAAVVINLGTNDAGQTGTTLSAFTTNLQNIITYLQARNIEVYLETPDRVSASNAIYTTGGDGNTYIVQLQRMVDAIRALARTNDLPLIDLWGPTDTYGYLSGLGGIYYSDGIHRLQAGYGLIAATERAALLMQ